MRASNCVSFVLATVAVGILSVSSVSAGGWAWDRDAGAKARGEFGGKGARETPTRSCRYGYEMYPCPPTVESRRSSSYQPVSNVSFKAGDQVTIARAGAKLMRGHDVLATLRKGQEVTVLKAQGQWIGASVEIDGKAKTGWLATRNVVGNEKTSAPAPKFVDDRAESQESTTTPCRREVYRPITANSESAGGLNSYWRDPFGLREYDPTIPLVLAHEWDPNIHEWKPWQIR